MDGQSTLIIAAAVAISGMISPVFLAMLTNRARRDEKEREWARRDLVADRAEASARRAEAATRDLIEINTEIAESNLGIASTVDVIHELVNSNMTQAIQSEYDATVREGVLMRELIAVHAADGRAPEAETLAALTTTDQKITELRGVLDARIAQQEAATANPPITLADVQPRLEALEAANTKSKE